MSPTPPATPRAPALAPHSLAPAPASPRLAPVALACQRSVEFATPLFGDEDRVDVYHDDEPLRYRTMDNIVTNLSLG